MISINLMKHLFKLALREAPDKVLFFIAKHGFPNLLMRSIDYFGKITGTKYLIKSNSIYPIEVAATRRWKIDPLHRKILTMNLHSCTVLDIGANVGTYSLLFCHARAKKVFAVEPGPFYDKLCYNASLNNLEKILIPIKLGISNQHRELSWHEDLSNKGNAHLLSPDFENFNDTTLCEKQTIVRCETLDSLCQFKIKVQIDLLKIDVEGMELDVLLSGKHILETDKPLIIIEMHPSNEKANEKVFSFLNQLGYKALGSLKLKKKLQSWANLPADAVFVPCCDDKVMKCRIALLG